jgi:hypothetical protein
VDGVTGAGVEGTSLECDGTEALMMSPVVARARSMCFAAAAKPIAASAVPSRDDGRRRRDI